MQGLHDGVHPAIRGEGAHAEFEVGDHMQHGRRTVGVAAVVGRVAVEELLQFGMAGARIPPVQLPGEREGAPPPPGAAEVGEGL